MQQVPAVDPRAVPSDVVLLDVREDDEWAAGHVAGAVHIPMMQVPQRLEHDPGPITPQTPIVVMCKGGGRSAQVTAWLLQHGYDATNMTGGLLAWQAAGRPLEADHAGPAEVI